MNTPLTDAAIRPITSTTHEYVNEMVDPDFARSLERMMMKSAEALQELLMVPDLYYDELEPITRSAIAKGQNIINQIIPHK